jgi:ABC-type multidrug transport system permease subunit
VRTLLAVAGLGIRQNLKNPLMTGLLVLAPVMLIFVIGESLRNVSPGDNPFEYITIVVLTQALAHGAVIGFWGIQKETHHHTLDRLAVAPLSSLSFVAGGFVASFTSLTGFMCVVALGSAIFLGVQTGPPLVLFAIIACASAFSAALGTLVGSVSGAERAGPSVLTFAVPLLILLGGGYFPIPESGVLAKISPYTPVRWINDSLRSVTTAGVQTNDWRIVLLCPIVAIGLLLLACLMMRRRWR